MTRIKTNFALLLAVCLVITSIFPVYATEVPETEQPVVQEEITETGTAQQEKTQVQEQSDPEEATPDKAVYEKEASSSETKESEPLTWEKEVDGIIITLTADPGVFPDGAELFAERVEDEKTEEAIEEAVEKERDNTANVASNYKFDIKMLVNGEEVQPDTSKGTVKVAFRLAEKINDCLEVNAYHLKEDAKGELTAETLDTEVKTVEESETENAVVTADEDGVLPDGDIENDIKKKVTAIEAETDGFSYYVVEFTYDELQYVLPGDSSIALSDILAQLKIEGTVADVEVSNPELFSADKDANGVWTVTAHQAFSSTEKMTVTMDDGEKYEIVVTDDATGITTWGALQDAIDAADDGATIRLTYDLIAGAGNSAISVSNAITLDLNNHKLDRGLTGSTTTSDGHCIIVRGTGNLTIVDESQEKGGVITGGNAANGGGVNLNVAGARFTMKGGKITGNHATNGGGVYVPGGAFFFMEEGIIEKNSATNGGGVYVSKTGGGEGGEFTMTGGNITDNSVTSNNGYGGGVYNIGTFTMENGSISDNKANGSQAWGGGVYNMGTFTMTNGSITGNNALKGGGVYNNGNLQIVFKMTGGSITNNTAKDSGGGVNINGEKWEVTVGGNAKIIGNITSESKLMNNLFKSNDKSLLIETPNPQMKIGVTLSEGLNIIATNTDANYARYFFADQSNKTVIGEDSEIRIVAHTHTALTHTPEQSPTYDTSGYKEHWKCVDVDCNRLFEDASGTILIDDIDMWKAEGGRGYIDKLKYSITFDTKGGSPIPLIQNVYKNGKVSEPEIKPTKDGYEFSCWCTDETATIPYDFETPVTGNFTLYAKWVENPSPDPQPSKSSGNTYTLYTGTGNNPVSTGKWTKNADGTWSYSTRYKFTETWGCIADAGKPDSKAWYYFDRNGRMLTGWHKLYWNGAYRWFYFSKTKDANEGKCQLGGITPDGYKVGPDGAWIE